MQGEPLQLEYGTDPGPSSRVVRATLLVVGILHALSALAFVAPGPLVRLAGVEFAGWSRDYVPPLDQRISDAAFLTADVTFVMVCAAALIRPGGRWERAVRVTAIAYLGVWLADGICDTVLQLKFGPWSDGGDLIVGRGSLMLANAAVVCAGVAREIGQTSLLMLIVFAYGHRPPDAGRLTRWVALAAAGVCVLKFLEQSIDLAGDFLESGLPVGSFRNLRDYVSQSGLSLSWGVLMVGFLLSGALVLATWRRWPRVAGLIAVAPFLAVELTVGRYKWWNSALPSAELLERVVRYVYGVSFSVFSATTPLLALLVLTILGQKPQPRAASARADAPTG